MDLRRQRGALVLLGAVMFVVMLAGCGGSSDGKLPPATGVLLTASTPTAGLNICVNCHSRQTTDWLTSKHANLISGDLYSAGYPTLGLVQAGAGCSACHDPHGDSNKVVAGFTGATRPVVGCETCHGGGSLHANAGGTGPINLISNASGTVLGTGPTVTVSGQFVMCTFCHDLLNTAGTGTATSAHGTGGTSPVGNQNIITDTHFATAGDWSGIGTASTKSITGYAMDFNDERVCVTCHNPHKPPTQNRDWAQSAHGDKGAFNLNATQTGYLSGAWAHYNWSTRPTCQRCHTTTGFAAYADALRNGDQALVTAINDGTLASSPVTSTAAWKPEMLKCNGCHTDNRGTLRNPGPITAKYDYVSSSKTYAKASYAYPDLAGSNVCMACHTGRESGDTVKGLNNPALLSAGTITTFDYSNMGFINSHYLTAGGQIFGVTGYEFEGRLYNNIDEYLHDKIGTPATQNNWPYVDTGSNGPCMSRPNKNGNHLFLPVSRSSATIGEVTGITSEVCFNCHGPSSTLILDLVKEQKSQFHEAILAFEDQLSARGIHFAPYNPYFFIASGFDPTYDEQTASPHCQMNSNLPVRNWQTDGTSNFTPSQNATTGAWSCTSTVANPGETGTGRNNMGAAFNFNLLEHDPGAYVHNRIYTKRLIYDSMDWLDDNNMNFSVGATLSALCAGGGAPSYCVEAITYLLPNGNRWDYENGSGIEAERP
jgi:hypothetical protein